MIFMFQKTLYTMASWPPWEVDEKGRMAQKGSVRTGHKLEDYFMIKTLGEGAYGVVYKGEIIIFYHFGLC